MNYYSLLWKLDGHLYLQYLFSTIKDIAMELGKDSYFQRKGIRSKVKHPWS